MKKILLHKILFLLIIVFIISTEGQTQVLISTSTGNPDGSAMLEIESGDKGILIPRLDRTSITTPVAGLLIYDTTDNAFFIYTSSGWINISTNANIWSRNASDVYLTNGTDNIGVGTNAPTSKFVVQADAGDDPNAVLFEVKDQTGEPILKVTSEGVRIFVKDTATAKGVSGGFAIGRYGAAKGFPDTTYFSVTPYSTQVNTIKPKTKGVAGGFAIGRYGAAKGVSTTYFQTTPDSTRVYTNVGSKAVSGGFAIGRYGAAKGEDSLIFFASKDSTRVYTQTSGKAVSGGFAIGRYGAAKGAIDNYMHITKDNYFIGHSAGAATLPLSGGVNNIFIGYESGLANTTGNTNTYLGFNTGRTIQTGTDNTFLGNSAGGAAISGDSSVFIGVQAGMYQSTGGNNVYVGNKAGSGISTGFRNLGKENIFIGSSAGERNTSGNYNLFTGYRAGARNNSGAYNVLLGYQAGTTYSNIQNSVYVGYNAGHSSYGTDNILIGTETGYENIGDFNIFIGDSSGYNNTGDQNVVIGKNAIFHKDQGDRGVYIGNNAGYWIEILNNSIFIGDSAGFGYDDGSAFTYPYSNILIGAKSGFTIGNGSSYNLIIGASAGQNIGTNSNSNTILGQFAGYSLGETIDADDNVIIGYKKGVNLEGNRNVMLGNGPVGSGTDRTISGSVHLGYTAGDNETTSNKLYIDNSNTATPLIYGDFGTDALRIHGTLTFNESTNYIAMPTTRGTTGQVLATNASTGQAYWTTLQSVSASNGLGMISNVIRLGGTLTQNTTITLGNYNLIFNTSGTGDIGVGTSSPLHQLHLYKSVNVTDGTDGNFIDIQNSSNSVGVLSGIRFKNGTGSYAKGGIFYQDRGNSGNGDIIFANNSSLGSGEASASDSRLIIKVDGKVGVGTTSPGNKFHVSGGLGNFTDTPADYIAQITNTVNHSQASVLSLVMATTSSGTGNDFITFFHNNTTAIGSLQGNGSSGIVLNSGGADFAEYLERIDFNEQIESGDIVGIYGGKISKNTENADMIQVISTSPIVLGNNPGEEKINQFEKVGFVGQVPVKVSGKVKIGDYIIASGDNNGIGYAISPDIFNSDYINNIVGIAWENSDDMGIKLINTGIGGNITNRILKEQFSRIDKVEKENQEIKKQIQELKELILNK